MTTDKQFYLATGKLKGANSPTWAGVGLPRFHGHIILWEGGVHDFRQERVFLKGFRRETVELVRSGRTPEE